MKSSDFVQEKFRAWAMRSGLALQGSAGNRGALNYVVEQETNFFRGLTTSTKKAFQDGAGKELDGTVPSISALHSSAAMSVNLFQYWLENDQPENIAKALQVQSTGISVVEFERKYPVCQDWAKLGLQKPPHLDLGIDYNDSRRVGVECKLSEPYYERHGEKWGTLSEKYLNIPDIWKDIPAWYALAKKLTESTEGFTRLDPAQLVKHALGLKFGKESDQVRLVYLYFDAIGDEAAEHRKEVQRFHALISNDPIHFVPVTVQEFIIRSLQLFRENHREYIDYIASRYL